MRKEDLFDAIGEVDTDLLLRSERYTEKPKRKWRTSMWIAAGVPATIIAVIVGVLIVSLPNLGKTPQEAPVQRVEEETVADLYVLSEQIMQEVEFRKAAGQTIEIEVYDKIFEMLGEGYQDLSVEEAAQKLVPWVEENKESVLSVINSMMRKQIQHDKTGITSTHYLSQSDAQNTVVIVASVLQDAANIVMNNTHDSVWQSTMMKRTVDLTPDSSGNWGLGVDAYGFELAEMWAINSSISDMEITCDWNVSYSYHVAEPNKLTLSERTDKLRKMTTMTESYLKSMSVSEMFFMTEREVKAELDEVAKRCSSDEIQFYFDENQIYFYRTVSGGNALDLKPDFQTFTIETDSGEKVEVSKANARFDLYYTLRTQQGISWMNQMECYSTIEEYMAVFDRNNLEKREFIMKFWIDDLECELFDSYLRIGADWYYLGDADYSVSKKLKYDIERMAVY